MAYKHAEDELDDKLRLLIEFKPLPQVASQVQEAQTKAKNDQKVIEQNAKKEKKLKKEMKKKETKDKKKACKKAKHVQMCFEEVEEEEKVRTFSQVQPQVLGSP